MKKTIVIIAAFFLIHLHVNKAHAQWGYKVVQSDFDGSFKKAFTDVIDGKYFMIMEEGDTSLRRISNFIPPGLGLYGGYWCETGLSVDLVFKQEGHENTVKQKVPCFVSSDNKYIIFNEEIWTDEFIRLFSNCTEMKIRVNQTTCDTKYITVNMSNSSEALNYMSNKNRRQP